MRPRTLALTLALLGAGLAAAGAAQEPPPNVKRVAEGRKLFIESGCHGCHTVGAMGTPIGPDLAHLGGKYPPDYLRRWLRDPAEQRPRAHMPKLELSEDQVQSLAAYLSSLR